MGFGRIAIASVGAMALLTACGGGFADESAETITAETKKDMLALESVHMVGEITTDDELIALDIALDTSGNCDGTIELGEDGESGFDIRSIDGTSWLKPTEAFWTQFAGEAAPTIIDAAGSSWVIFPGEQADQFAELCDLDQFLEGFGDDEDTKVEVGETSEIDGQEVVAIETESDSGDPVTGFVTVEEPHYLLKIEANGEEPGELVFSEFDEPLDLAAPSEDEVFDLTDLSG